MEALGMVVTVLGVAVAFIGYIIVLLAAFRESLAWGLLVFLIHFVGLIFVITHWEESKQGFVIYFIGVIVAVIGLALMAEGRAAPDMEEEEVFRALSVFAQMAA